MVIRAFSHSLAAFEIVNVANINMNSFHSIGSLSSIQQARTKILMTRLTKTTMTLFAADDQFKRGMDSISRPALKSSGNTIDKSAFPPLAQSNSLLIW